MVKYLYLHSVLIKMKYYFSVEEVQKWRLLKKFHHTELVKRNEKVIRLIGN